MAPIGTTISESGGFAPEADSWVQDLADCGLASSTIDCYCRDLRDGSEAIARLIGRPAVSADLADIQQPEVDQLVKYWQAGGTSVATVLRRFAALRGFARFLWCRDGLNCLGIISARLPQMTPVDRPSIDEDAFDVIRSAPPVDGTWIELRDRAAFLLQAATGMTTAEAVALDCSNVLDGGTAIVVTNSARATRILATNVDAQAGLRKYQAVAPFELAPARPLFVNRKGERLSTRSLQISFCRLRIDFGLRATTSLMSLRHRVGEHLAASSNSPAFVAERLGISVHSVGRYFAAERHRNVAPSDRKQRRQTGRRTGQSRRQLRGRALCPILKPVPGPATPSKKGRSKVDP